MAAQERPDPVAGPVHGLRAALARGPDAAQGRLPEDRPLPLEFAPRSRPDVTDHDLSCRHIGDQYTVQETHDSIRRRNLNSAARSTRRPSTLHASWSRRGNCSPICCGLRTESTPLRPRIRNPGALTSSQFTARASATATPESRTSTGRCPRRSPGRAGQGGAEPGSSHGPPAPDARADGMDVAR